jgi:hypothetical protein
VAPQTVQQPVSQRFTAQILCTGITFSPLISGSAYFDDLYPHPDPDPHQIEIRKCGSGPDPYPYQSDKLDPKRIRSRINLQITSMYGI